MSPKTMLNDKLLQVALIGVVLMAIGVASVQPFQSIIGIERIGFSDAAFALIITCGAAISVAASVTAGIYTDQTGKFRTALQCALLIGMSGGLFMFFAPSKVAFIIVHVILFPAGATAFTQYFAIATVAANENPALNRASTTAFVRAAFSAAFALTPLAWGYALAKGVDLLTAYAIVAAANLIAFIVISRLWSSSRRLEVTGTSGKGFFASLSELTDRGLLVRLALICVISASNAFYNILLGLLILNNLGGAEPDVAVFAGVIAFIEIPVMILIVRCLNYVSQSFLIMVGVFIYGGFLAVLGLLPSMTFAWWLTVPAGIGAGILLSIPIGYIQGLLADRAGAGSALLSVNHFGGMIFASTVFALGTSFTGYDGVAIIGSSLAITASIALYVLDRRKLVRIKAAVQN